MHKMNWNYVAKDGNPKKEGVYLAILIFPEYINGKETGRQFAEFGAREFADAKKYGTGWVMDDQPDTGLAWIGETGDTVGEYVYAWASIDASEEMLPEGVTFAQ